MRIAVLITSYNRIEILKSTLRTVENLFIPDSVFLDYYLLEDFCTDNTVEDIKSHFPGVKIYHGDGNLFWNRGMLKLWDIADAASVYDFFLWLNEDTKLYPEALIQMLDGVKHSGSSNTIVVGAISFGQNDLRVSYGGYVNKELISPIGEYQSIDYFNGNLVLVPRQVIDRIGKLSPFFRHSFGDFEYGMRAKRVGVQLFLTKSFVGECKRNSWPPKYLNSNYNLWQRLQHLYSPLGFNPVESFYIEYKFNSLVKAVLVFLKIHLNLLFPEYYLSQRKSK
jgi:GT2 family glycosyltransferase